MHGYIDVDAPKVYQMLQNDLGDFDSFFSDVSRIIESVRAKENGADREKDEF